MKNILFLAVMLLPSCQTTENPVATTQIPDSSSAAFNKGNALAREGLYTEAAEAYRSTLKSNPKYLPAARNLGMVYVKLGNYGEAIPLLKEALKAFENNFEAHFYLAESYRMEASLADAIYHYRRALSLREQDPKAMKALSWSYFKIRDYPAALSMIQQLEATNIRDEQVPIIKARTLIELGRYKQAAATLSKARGGANQKQQAYLDSVQGDLYKKTGQLVRAEKLYRSALRVDPMLAGALMGLGQVMITRPSQKVKGLELIERAVRVKPQMTEAYYVLANGYRGISKKKAKAYSVAFIKQGLKDPEYATLVEQMKERFAAAPKGQAKASSSLPSGN